MRVAVLTELAVAVTLAAVLGLLTPVRMPYGGSVSLQTLPLFIVALRHGVRPGVLAGAAYGVVNLLLRPYFVHPVQLLLDYPVAFGLLGLAGLGAGTRSLWVVPVCVLAASGARFVVHVLSGVVFFGQMAPQGTPVWQYSLIYNASYMVPETLIAAAVTAFVHRRLQRR